MSIIEILDNTPEAPDSEVHDDFKVTEDTFIVEDRKTLCKEYKVDQTLFDNWEKNMMEMDIMFRNNVQPHISGGAIRRIFSGEKFDEDFQGDVDLFICDTGLPSFDNVVEYMYHIHGLDFTKYDPTWIYEKNIIFRDEHKWQLMQSNFSWFSYDTQKNNLVNLSRFDAYCNMFTYLHKTDEILYHKNAIKDVLEKRYVANPFSTSHPVSVLARIEKFTKMGWEIPHESKENICRTILKNQKKLGITDNYVSSVEAV